MSAPVVVPREDHPISRRDIDPDALRVLYRLQQSNHVAYLVGGSVRDLILGRRPKDFDIGTDAHPHQIKRLFRNCWIIGRRFRLAHIKFGLKTIEVATFRKNVADLPPDVPPDQVLDRPTEYATAAAEASEASHAVAPHGAKADASVGPAEVRLPERTFTEPDGTVVVAARIARTDASRAEDARAAKAEIVRRDNAFGTTEEDAFRRDFTVNALFYDASTRTVIDYVGGLGDLERRVIRSIGDPRVRFVEDPVRMLRAAVLGARLGFDLDVLVVEAIAELRHLITTSSPARLLEEVLQDSAVGIGRGQLSRARAREAARVDDARTEIASGGVLGFAGASRSLPAQDARRAAGIDERHSDRRDAASDRRAQPPDAGPRQRRRWVSGARQFRGAAGRAQGSRSATTASADASAPDRSGAAAARGARPSPSSQFRRRGDVARRVWRRPGRGGLLEGAARGPSATTPTQPRAPASAWTRSQTRWRTPGRRGAASRCSTGFTDRRGWSSEAAKASPPTAARRRRYRKYTMKQ